MDPARTSFKVPAAAWAVKDEANGTTEILPGRVHSEGHTSGRRLQPALGWWGRNFPARSRRSHAHRQGVPYHQAGGTGAIGHGIGGKIAHPTPEAAASGLPGPAVVGTRA